MGHDDGTEPDPTDEFDELDDGRDHLWSDVVFWVIVGAVVLAVLVALDLGWRNAALDTILDRIESTEEVKAAVWPRFEDAFAGESLDRLGREEARRRIVGVLADLESDLVVEADPMEDVLLLPWWRSLREFRSDYLAHVDAWKGWFARGREEPQTLLEPDPEVSSTLRLACSAGVGAVPFIDVKKATPRIEQLCES